MARVQTEQRGYIPSYVRQQVLNDCNRICSHCGVSLRMGDNFTLEHVIPLNKGGKNDISNYVALCEDCNKDKSDDVVEPNDYYMYLPKTKRNELQALFEEYCKTTDWLGYDNIFKTDRFTISVGLPVIKPTGIINVPSSFRVEKVKRTEAFNFLTVYKGRLSVEDKDLIAYDESELNTPYYKVSRKDNLIMLISPYIMKVNTTAGTEQNVLFMDVHVNPDLKRRQTTIPMLYNILQVLRFTMQQSLSVKGMCSAIGYSIRTPSSDELGLKTLQELKRLNPDGYGLTCIYKNPNNTGGCVYHLDGVVYHGSMSDFGNLAKSNGFSSIKDFFTDGDVSVLQQPIEARLSRAKEIPKVREVKKPKKKDKKASKKHKR